MASKDKKIYALSDMLEVPLMKIEATGSDVTSDMTLSIRPSHHVISQALYDLMEFFVFTDIAVVYDGKIL